MTSIHKYLLLFSTFIKRLHLWINSGFLRKKTFFSPYGFLVFLLNTFYLLPTVKAQETPFPCDGSFYISHAPNEDSPSTILKVKLNPLDNSVDIDTIAQMPGIRLSPIGFRIKDNLIYGLDPINLDIYKVDAKGIITKVGSVADYLNKGLDYYAGEISPSGNRFFVMGRSKTSGWDETLYSIRLDRGDLRVGRQSVLSDQGSKIEDMIFHPFFGTLNGYDALKKKMVSINWLFGRVEDILWPVWEEIDALAGMSYDQEGNILGFGRFTGAGQRDTEFFTVKRGGKIIENIGSMEGSKHTDGCSCPYSVTVEQSYTPAIAIPCATVKAKYLINNQAGTTYLNINLTDTLPASITSWKAIHLPRSSKLIPNDDPRIVELSFNDFLLGPDSLVLEIELGENFQGTASSQAVLDSFPFSLNPVFLGSKENFPELPPDFNIEPLSISLPDSAGFCLNQQTLLNASIYPPGNEADIIWNTGETNTSIIVDQSGWYTITALSSCQLATDSIYVEERIIPLEIELGPDREIQWGTTIELSVSSNSNEALQLRWESSIPNVLDCDDCDKPSVQTAEETIIYLFAKDSYGCEAMDSVKIIVDRSIDIQTQNVFTPNNDGINDVFFFRGEGLIEVRNFRILNSWGREVHQMSNGRLNDPAHAWNGNIGDNSAPPDVYYWYAEFLFPDGSSESQSGNILLIR